MRIIGGEARGRAIRLPAGCRIRPTTDRVKKSLFDILPPLTEKSFLDLFAGCGNVGLEALSRGARFAAFLEKETRLADAIRVNLQILRFEERAEVIASEAERGIGHLVKRKARFDIVFADPPYDMGFVIEIMKWLEGGALLDENGIVVLQHSVREALDVSQATVVVTDRRRYGDTMLSFLMKNKGSAYEEDSGISRFF
jgi:16S rRNA (guanine966-N2)-methyltransferase